MWWTFSVNFKICHFIIHQTWDSSQCDTLKIMLIHLFSISIKTLHSTSTFYTWKVLVSEAWIFPIRPTYMMLLENWVSYCAFCLKSCRLIWRSFPRLFIGSPERIQHSPSSLMMIVKRYVICNLLTNYHILYDKAFSNRGSSYCGRCCPGHPLLQLTPRIHGQNVLCHLAQILYKNELFCW